MYPPPAYIRPAWYDHNSAGGATLDGSIPRPRVANDKDAFKNLHRQQYADTMNWYRHEHDDDRLHLSRPKIRSAAATANAQRMNGFKPEWISQNNMNGDSNHCDVISDVTMSRVTSEGQEYRDRNLNGAASQWWSHDNAPRPARLSYRVGSEGYDYASRARNISENWVEFSPEDNPPLAGPPPRLLSVTALALQERGRGQIQHLLTQEEDDMETETESVPLPRLHSDGYHIKQLHSGTGMAQLFQQVADEVSQSLPSKRLPSQAELVKRKHQGEISEVLTGYPDPPVRRHRGRRITSEGRINELRHRDQVNGIMNFNGTSSPDMCITGRPMRPRPPGGTSSAGQQVAEVFARYGQPAPPPTSIRGLYSRRHMASHVGRLLLQPQAFM